MNSWSIDLQFFVCLIVYLLRFRMTFVTPELQNKQKCKLDLNCVTTLQYNCQGIMAKVFSLKERSLNRLCFGSEWCVYTTGYRQWYSCGSVLFLSFGYFSSSKKERFRIDVKHGTSTSPECIVNVCFELVTHFDLGTPNTATLQLITVGIFPFTFVYFV